MATPEKHKRTENFVSEERAFLIEAIRERKHVEMSKNDANAVKRKNQTWQDVCEKVGATFPARPKRPLKPLKDFWRRAKIKAKNETQQPKPRQS